MPPSLEANWNSVLRRIASAAVESGRGVDVVALVAVTKSVPASLAAELCRLGQVDLGENRADELERKVAHFRAGGIAARWHFVGHVQRNKARRIVRAAAVIHSVDSIELCLLLARVAREEGRRPEIYLEVKLSPEPTKTGFAPRDLRAAVLRTGELAELDLVGLMTIAPLELVSRPPDPGRAARTTFEALAALARSMEADPATRACFQADRVRTSMGMSDDFEAAITSGSDIVRIGSALFTGIEANVSGEPAL